MDSALASQLSSEFEAAFSKILPELAQVLQSYKISQTLEVFLESDFLDVAMAARSCCLIKGILYCPCRLLTAESNKDSLGLDEEKAGQLSSDVESKLRTVFPQLSPVVKQVKESFEIQLGINPDSVNGHLSCKFIDGVLVCS
jgi:hypothetical protein